MPARSSNGLSGDAGATRADTDAPGDLAGRTRIGRFHLLEELGAGGMGVVFAAYDPLLDRRVALKLVRRELANGHPHELLVREAKALARLDHPNVVRIHDVVIAGNDVVLSMELVNGETMGAWLARGPHPTSEVMRVLLAAGEGLAAAHRAGVVHRDFKPSNVLIARDGRVRVIDFGIAGDVGGVAGGPPPVSIDREAPATALAVDSDTPVAAAPAMLPHGTPRFAAPEQRAGQPVDQRSDQWSFSVIALDALGTPRPCLGAALRRGAAPSPAARWGDLGPILRAMRRDLGRPRRLALRVAMVSATLVAVATGVVAGWAWTGAGRTLAPCALDALAPADVLDPATRARLTGTWLAGAPSTASRQLSTLFARLDAYRATWRREWQAACRATRVTGEQSERLLDARIACLDRGLEAARHLIALAHMPSVDHELAVDATIGLPQLEACAATARRRSALDAPPREAVPITLRLERLHVQQALHAASALSEARATAEDARRAGYAPVIAEALLELSRAEARAGQPDIAIATAEQAYFTAIGGRDDEHALSAAGLLVGLLGATTGDRAAWRSWAQHGEALASRYAGEAPLEAEIDLRLGLGAAYARDGNYLEAKRQGERAVVIDEANGSRVIEARSLLAYALSLLGDLRGAREMRERVLVVAEQMHGPRHGSTTIARYDLAMSLADDGSYELAERHLRRGLELAGTEPGPAALLRAKFALGLGFVEQIVGDLEAARAHLQTALALRQDAYGPDGLPVGDTLGQLANLEMLRRDPPAADAALARSIAILEARLGADHRLTALAVGNRGILAVEQADPRGGLRGIDRALRVLDRDHPNRELQAAVLELHAYRASALLAVGRVAEAARAIDRGRAIVDRVIEPTYGTSRARLWFVQGQLAARRGDHAAVPALVERALAASTDRALPVARLRQSILAWRQGQRTAIAPPE